MYFFPYNHHHQQQKQHCSQLSHMFTCFLSPLLLSSQKSRGVVVVVVAGIGLVSTVTCVITRSEILIWSYILITVVQGDKAQGESCVSHYVSLWAPPPRPPSLLCFHVEPSFPTFFSWFVVPCGFVTWQWEKGELGGGKCEAFCI